MPSTHGSQALAPSGEYSPAVQSRQVNWPGFGFNAARGIAARLLKVGGVSADLPAFEEFSAKNMNASDPQLIETLKLELEWQSRGGQIVIAESTLEEAGEDIRVTGETEVTLKGVPEPVRLYEVGGLTAEGSASDT